MTFYSESEMSVPVELQELIRKNIPRGVDERAAVRQLTLLTKDHSDDDDDDDEKVAGAFLHIMLQVQLRPSKHWHIADELQKQQRVAPSLVSVLFRALSGVRRSPLPESQASLSRTVLRSTTKSLTPTLDAAVQFERLQQMEPRMTSRMPLSTLVTERMNDDEIAQFYLLRDNMEHTITSLRIGDGDKRLKNALNESDSHYANDGSLTQQYLKATNAKALQRINDASLFVLNVYVSTQASSLVHEPSGMSAGITLFAWMWRESGWRDNLLRAMLWEVTLVAELGDVKRDVWLHNYSDYVENDTNLYNGGNRSGEYWKLLREHGDNAIVKFCAPFWFMHMTTQRNVPSKTRFYDAAYAFMLQNLPTHTTVSHLTWYHCLMMFWHRWLTDYAMTHQLEINLPTTALRGEAELRADYTEEE